MANPQYEMMLEIALRLAIQDTGEYDVKTPKVEQYLFDYYLEEAKKILDKRG